MIPPKIKIDYAGRVCFVSYETYKWSGNQSSHQASYPDSTFQLISGINNSKVPGYHFRPGWVTVCPVEKDRPALFLGVPKTALQLIPQP